MPSKPRKKSSTLDHTKIADKAMHDVSDVGETVDQIKAWHRKRCYAMECRKAADLRLGAFIRSSLGWSLRLPDKERKEIAEQAADLLENPSGEYEGIIAASIAARKPFDAIEKQAVKEMQKLAESLPVWEQFGQEIRGFGAVSLAVILGEAGDLSNYSSYAKVWKRMGLAVMDDKRQGHVAKGLSADDRKAAFIEHGYSPVRRSRMWNIGDTLIKGNRTGAYRTAYLDRKAYELAREPEMQPMKAHRRAQRVMEKRLLKHLWQAWRRTIYRVAEKPTERMSDANLQRRAA